MAYTDYLNTVQEMYIAYYNRPADPQGLLYWAAKLDAANGDMHEIIDAFANSPEAKELYGNKSIEEQINAIYQAAFNRNADPEGLKYYTEQIKEGKITLGSLAIDVLNGAKNEDKLTLENKLKAAMEFTKALDPNLDGKDLTATYDSQDITAAREYLKKVTFDPVTIPTKEEVEKFIQTKIANADDKAEIYTLTAGHDDATAHIFKAGMIYTPNGGDRILALQDDDVLNGSDKYTDNELDLTLGQANSDEGEPTSVTPTLHNIQKINMDVTGNINTVDLRYADSTQEININKVTQSAANNIMVQNISTPAATLSVKDDMNSQGTVTFNYERGVLHGNETLNLNLENDNFNTLTISSNDNRGFEKINLNVSKYVELNNLNIATNDTRELVINGDGELKLEGKTPIVNANQVEGFLYNGSAITSPSLKLIDASNFNGQLYLDITNATRYIDVNNSGTMVYSTVKGSSGDDVFIKTNAINSGETIDGGEGTDKLIQTANINSGATIKGIENLYLQNQGSPITADLSDFDNSLQNVEVRAVSTNGSFTLDNVSADLAKKGIIVDHETTNAAGNGVQTSVNIYLADATGNNDTATVELKDAPNTNNSFSATLNIAGETSYDGIPNNDVVENVTLKDNDTESNIISLTQTDKAGNSALHTGTIKIEGGEAGEEFMIANSPALVAKTIDASNEKSNVYLTLGTANQTVTTGSGNDIVSVAYNNLDSLDSFDLGDGTDLIDITNAPNATLDFTNNTDVNQNGISDALEKLGSVKNVEGLGVSGNETIYLSNGLFDKFNKDLTIKTIYNDSAVIIDANQNDKQLNPAVTYTDATVNADLSHYITTTFITNSKNQAVFDKYVTTQNQIYIGGVNKDIVKTGLGSDIFNFTDKTLNAGDEIDASSYSLTDKVNANTTVAGTLGAEQDTMNLSINVGNTVSAAQLDGLKGFEVLNLSGIGSSATTKTVGIVLDNIFAANNHTLQQSSNFQSFNNFITISTTAGYDYSIDASSVTDNSVGFKVTGNSGNDTIKTGAGNDNITMTSGNDTIETGGGNDIVQLNPANVQLGTDTIDMGDGTDLIELAQGAATVDLRNVTFKNVEDLALNGNTVTVNAASVNNSNLTLVEINNPLIGVQTSGTLTVEGVATGTGMDDTINLNHLQSGTYANPVGSNVFDPTTIKSSNIINTSITVDGNSGKDTIDLSQLTFSNGIANSWNNGALKIKDTTNNASSVFATIYGDNATISQNGDQTNSADDDTIYGSKSGDIIYGGDGKDDINGNGGDDIIYGGRSTDKMTGGAGNDVFVLNDPFNGADNITDFQHDVNNASVNHDRIAIDLTTGSKTKTLNTLNGVATKDVTNSKLKIITTAKGVNITKLNIKTSITNEVVLTNKMLFKAKSLSAVKSNISGIAVKAATALVIAYTTSKHKLYALQVTDTKTGTSKTGTKIKSTKTIATVTLTNNSTLTAADIAIF